MFFDFLKYFLKANNAHGIHSPFVFELYTKIYRDFSELPDFERIESVRKSLRDRKDSIAVMDFGAGSKHTDQSVRSVGDIARKSLSSPFWSKFFYKMIRFYGYNNVLELGTSLGVTTSYLALACPEGNVYTIEGCGNTLNVATETFERLGIDHVQATTGSLDECLQDVLNQVGTVDFVLFDANHRLEPTLRYFEQCYAHSGEQSVFVFDDIYWSKEMREAWRILCADPRVSISVDFFHVGLVFFRKGVEKQHFVLK